MPYFFYTLAVELMTFAKRRGEGDVNSPTGAASLSCTIQAALMTASHECGYTESILKNSSYR